MKIFKRLLMASGVVLWGIVLYNYAPGVWAALAALVRSIGDLLE